MSDINADISINKLLLPIDGSNTSIKAARYAIHLAKLNNAELVIMHIIEDIKQGGAIGLQQRYGNISLVEAFKKAREESAKQLIKPIEEVANKKGLKVKSEICDAEGTNSIKLITEYTDKNNIDLIVIGSKGRSIFERLLVGSLTNAVINHSPCPVLVVR
jgi:nucleotide-binding universal stress UspA family protein